MAVLESVKRYLGDLLSNDPRKKEYGDLEDIRRGRKERSPLRERSRVRLGPRNKTWAGANFAGNGSRRMLRKERMARSVKTNGIAKKRPPTHSSSSGLKSLWNSIRTVFTNEDQNLDLLQLACSNVTSIVPSRKTISGPEERRQLKERIARSEAFKRKVNQLKYDDDMLQELRRGRSRQRTEDPYIPSLTDDQVTLLQKKITQLEKRLKDALEDLQITQKRLKFAKEKNTLLESLLDDANIDREYVESRRDIKNIQRDNLKPDTELPPSPRRTVNPLFTSSPMRNVASREEPASSATDFYNKYPKIPETEALANNQRNDSLSPIRIDYSKYSV